MKLIQWLRERKGEAKATQTEVPLKIALPVKKEPKHVPVTLLTENEQVVTDHLQHINNREEMTHFHADANIMFKDAPMTLGGFQEELRRIFDSLPDFKLHIVGPIQEQADGTVLATMYATGTHTGKPYSFGPFPEVDPKGTAIKLDAEYVATATISINRIKTSSTDHRTHRNCFFTVRDGKIVHIKVMPLGESTGPPGVYTQLGGLVF